MARHGHQKQEKIVEAVRQGLTGDDSIEFLHQCGFAMSTSGISRHLKKMGGRGTIEQHVEDGLSNIEILERCLPGEKLDDVTETPRSQGELFAGLPVEFTSAKQADTALYNSTKMTIDLPSEIHEAVRAMAQAEGKSQKRVIVEILHHALSRLPEPVQQEFE